MESFLDEYQRIRLGLSLGGVLLVAIFAFPGTWQEWLAVVALGLSGSHAVWCLHRKVRSPRTMLLIDLSIWGAFMLISAGPVINTALLTVLWILAVLFAEGYLLAWLLVYLGTLYSLSYFNTEGLTAATAGIVAAALFMIGGMAVMVYQVRAWMGRLDANRSQMLGTVSHELRNTLTGIMGLTEVVSSSEDLDPGEARELIDLAHQQAVDATEIVEDMLTATSLERTTLRVEVEAVDLNQEVATTVRRFVGLGTPVRIDVSESRPMVLGDALRVRQILRNLVSNAVRYGGDNIVVSTTAEGDKAQIIVGDDGEGVPRQDEGTIFLPYRRSTNTRRDAASIGLGLWICRQLALAMDGTLAYRRSDGATQFILTLGLHRQNVGHPAKGGSTAFPIELPASG
jgi:signal transduction histidine kinase